MYLAPATITFMFAIFGILYVDIARLLLVLMYSGYSYSHELVAAYKSVNYPATNSWENSSALRYWVVFKCELSYIYPGHDV